MMGFLSTMKELWDNMMESRCNTIYERSITIVPPCKGYRVQLILNQLTYGLPTFGFAGTIIWWFKLFFFFLQNASTLLYAFISMNICPGGIN